MDFQLLLIALLIVSFAWLVQRWSTQARKSNLPFPPGPKAKPIVGNLLDLPLVDAHNVYMEWEKKYGSSILYANAWGDHIIILNKREDMEELFERRSSIYSDRPHIPVLELLGWSWNWGPYHYGPAWRLHRKLAQKGFGQSASKQYQPIQLRKTHDMLRFILHAPDDFMRHRKLLSVGILMSILYGYDIPSIDEPCVQMAEQATHAAAVLVVPGASLVNLFPFMRHLPAWVPGCGFQTVAAECRKLTEEMKRLPKEYVAEQMKQGTAQPSFITDFLLNKTASGASEEEEEAMWNIGYTFYGAVSETTESMFGSIFHLLAAYPDVQRKAQEEIELVTGKTRLPQFSDRPDMPYSEAFYREVLRFRPPLPQSLPHRATEDDTFKGYFIPKGGLIFQFADPIQIDHERPIP